MFAREIVLVYSSLQSKDGGNLPLSTDLVKTGASERFLKHPLQAKPLNMSNESGSRMRHNFPLLSAYVLYGFQQEIVLHLVNNHLCHLPSKPSSIYHATAC